MTKSNNLADAAPAARRVSFPADENLPRANNPTLSDQVNNGPLTASPPGSPGLPARDTALETTNTTATTVPARNDTATPTPSMSGSAAGARRRNPTVNKQVTLGPGTPIRRQTSESGRSSRRGSTYEPHTGVIRRMTTGLFTPPKPVGKAPTYWSSIKAAVTCTWL